MESRLLACTPSEVPRNFHLAVSFVTDDITSRRSSSPSSRSREYQLAYTIPILTTGWTQNQQLPVCMLPQKMLHYSHLTIIVHCCGQLDFPESSYSCDISNGLPDQLTKYGRAIHTLPTWRKGKEKNSKQKLLLNLTKYNYILINNHHAVM